ncbi:Type III secretion system substrate exporter, FlhB-like [Allopseudospirillum japonicum]|uniref:Flagellar biosynthetic protein FlhB n=1 Tax=Allopseudospirillum japonicum TaxID=64971 RepID=A0A1H6QQR0_9GAMM|nr:EscU/YscU/HrcU family type III secretion system export apparatus switch protein [Allopseudospirillum japonicum]SEI46158.1 Type III secretion system substrate exporter, FlhB-like [Allopseudospirillum japonicum]
MSESRPSLRLGTRPHPPKRAIALHYDGKGAPKVTAKGMRQIAEQIISTAEAHGVPLYEDATLANALAHLELGDEIPQLLYMAIAEVIAFVYELNLQDQHHLASKGDTAQPLTPEDLSQHRRQKYQHQH